jgi:hypothetical protein
LVNIGSIHLLNMIWNTVFLNSYIYWNGMFFLTIICIYFIETTQNYTIFWYMYCYQFVALPEILAMTKRNSWLITSDASHHWIFCLTRNMMTFLVYIGYQNCTRIHIEERYDQFIWCLKTIILDKCVRIFELNSNTI